MLPDRKLFLDFSRDCLLYTPLSTVPVPPPHVHSHGPPAAAADDIPMADAEAPAAVAAEAPVAPAVAAPPAALAPAGLSKVRVQRVVGKGTLDGGALIDLKMGLLNFMAAVGMKGEEALVHYLVRARGVAPRPLVCPKTSRRCTCVSDALVRHRVAKRNPGPRQHRVSGWETHGPASIPTIGSHLC